MNRLHLFIILYIIAVCAALFNGYKYSEAVKKNDNLKAALLGKTLVLEFCKRQYINCRSQCFYSKNDLDRRFK